MVSGVATYCMIVGLCIAVIILGFIIMRIIKHKQAKKETNQEHPLEENNFGRRGDDPPIQQQHTSVQVDRPPAYEADTKGLSPPPKYITKNS
ncbi:hypothetical protein INT45_004749 [Circinella minor]|uniref:Uncharacterized protein n=1 Tax=Circinella minor TaxID=1195481 RepID=A0A8H7VQK4_9FUNG|nr:hypothetical protein INT45_004749 [Circinella minor]